MVSSLRPSLLTSIPDMLLLRLTALYERRRVIVIPMHIFYAVTEIAVVIISYLNLNEMHSKHFLTYIHVAKPITEQIA